jgi:hypothetical protein
MLDLKKNYHGLYSRKYLHFYFTKAEGRDRTLQVRRKCCFIYNVNALVRVSGTHCMYAVHLPNVHSALP